MSARISACYYPTTVLFIDDNEQFIDFINFNLGKNIAIKTLSHPNTALQFLQEYTLDPFTRHCVHHVEEEEADQRRIDIDIRAIHQEIYKSKRFNQISVIVVDYAMPGMNGLDLSKQIPRLIKKILLTGEADEKIAIKAFNEGLIDKFIRKDDINFIEQVKHDIIELQQNYFDELSKIIIDALTKDVTRPRTSLDDPKYIEFFHELVKKNHVVEYYLLDPKGSFLFLNNKGTPSWLVVADQEMMEGYTQLAEDDHAPVAVTQALKERKKIPFFFSDEDFQVRPADWQSYLHPANTLEGQDTYYYAYIQTTEHYKLEQNNLLSYSAFLEQL